jgi:rod shape-determining protein MreD
MFKHICLILLTYFALVLQTSARVPFTIGTITPVFLPLVLLVVIFFFESPSALLWAATIGLLDDCLTPEKLGTGIVCSTFILFLVQRRLRLRPAESIFSVMLYGGFTLFGLLLATSALRTLLNGESISSVSQFTPIIGTVFYTSLIGLFVFLCCLFGKRILVRFLPSSVSRRTSRWHMLVD